MRSEYDHRAIIIRRFTRSRLACRPHSTAYALSRPFQFAARFIALLALAALSVAAGAWWWLAQPLALPSSPFVFDVKSGSTLKAVARDLTAAKVLSSEWPLVALARLRGVDRTIKAGNYEIVDGVTLPGLLRRLTQGDVTAAALTILEGSTFGDLKAALAADPGVKPQAASLPDGEVVEQYTFTLCPGEETGWHYHQGNIWVVVISGTLTEDRGCNQPLEVHNAGTAFAELPGVVHNVTNSGNAIATVAVQGVGPSCTAGFNDLVPLNGPVCDKSGNNPKRVKDPDCQ